MQNDLANIGNGFYRLTIKSNKKKKLRKLPLRIIENEVEYLLPSEVIFLTQVVIRQSKWLIN